jgi:hypothetical protein
LRSLTTSEDEERVALLERLQEINLETSPRDELGGMHLGQIERIQNKILYRFITHRGMCLANSSNLWKTKLPLKIKIFFGNSPIISPLSTHCFVDRFIDDVGVEQSNVREKGGQVRILPPAWLPRPMSHDFP